MAELTDTERAQIPDFHEINRVQKREFEIHDVNKGEQVLWIEDSRGFRISFLLRHIGPDSDLGSMVKELPKNDYVTLSGVRLTKSSDHMPRWYLTEITDVRSSSGPERNVFE